MPRPVGGVDPDVEDASRSAPRRSYDRPEGVDDDTVEALGKLSEAWEVVERARGHLFAAHQLMGRADGMFGDAAAMLDDAGHADASGQVSADVVGRNILDGRWTFQVVDEFDDAYYRPVRAVIEQIEADLVDGRRHIYESEMKDDRRSAGRPGHERRPPARDPETT